MTSVSRTPLLRDSQCSSESKLGPRSKDGIPFRNGMIGSMQGIIEHSESSLRVEACLLSHSPRGENNCQGGVTCVRLGYCIVHVELVCHGQVHTAQRGPALFMIQVPPFPRLTFQSHKARLIQCRFLRLGQCLLRWL